MDLSQSGFLSEEDYLRWTRRVAPRPGDVVFSYETRLGEAALIPKGLRCSLGRRLALMRPDTTKVDPRFLLYSFLGPEFQETIRKNTVHGSTVNRIMLTDFPSFGMAIPPIDEQRAIAATLGALDDKIESNRRTSALISGLVSAEFQAGLATASGSEIALGAVISCTKGVSYKSVDLQESRTSLVTLKSL
ncbi:MAG: restriction endonuclease subunit S [Kineosporiaceae bacterium]|nr:restriction endonuclease subunit S [Kineosporiaceae bacterium]